MNNAEVQKQAVDGLLPFFEEHGLQWEAPFRVRHVLGSPLRPLRQNLQQYNGFNRMALAITALKKGYVSPVWLTFLCANKLGAHVKKGEKSTPIVYFDKMTKKVEDRDTGDMVDKNIWFLKLYRVFNTSQIEGLAPQFYQTIEVEQEDPVLADERVETFAQNLGFKINRGGAAAFFEQSSREITLPDRKYFVSTPAYNGTLFHEEGHATMVPLERKLDRHLEEAVAEMTSLWVCIDLGVPRESDKNVAAYIKSWVPEFAKDPNKLFQVCHHTQKAVEWMHSRQKTQENVVKDAFPLKFD